MERIELPNRLITNQMFYLIELRQYIEETSTHSNSYQKQRVFLLLSVNISTPVSVTQTQYVSPLGAERRLVFGHRRPNHFRQNLINRLP